MPPLDAESEATDIVESDREREIDDDETVTASLLARGRAVLVKKLIFNDAGDTSFVRHVSYEDGRQPMPNALLAARLPAILW